MTPRSASMAGQRVRSILQIGESNRSKLEHLDWGGSRLHGGGTEIFFGVPGVHRPHRQVENSTGPRRPGGEAGRVTGRSLTVHPGGDLRPTIAHRRPQIRPISLARLGFHRRGSSPAATVSQNIGSLVVAVPLLPAGARDRLTLKTAFGGRPARRNRGCCHRAGRGPRCPRTPPGQSNWYACGPSAFGSFVISW
jgi:hypothetical protein